MSIQSTCLVLADISGYTNFVRQPALSLLHAEQIITELLESVIDLAANPLQLNKLEGDAALMFAHCGDRPADAAKDVANQADRFFAAFRARQQRLAMTSCSCDACGGIANLKLKVVLHVGDVLLKKVRHFEELAGEPVILAHLLLKNSVMHDEYLLMTESFRALTGKEAGDAREEACGGFGLQQVHIYYPHGVAPASPPATAASSSLLQRLHPLRLSLRAQWNRITRPARNYRNLAKP